MPPKVEQVSNLFRVQLTVLIATHPGRSSIPPLFWRFFTDFPGEFRRQVAELVQRDSTSLLQPVRLWKTLGDELIFTVELAKKDQLIIFLKAFAHALRWAARNWHNDPEDASKKELHLKGACWLAGFPVGNAEMPMEVGQSGDFIDPNDYIGPMIDTGFRIKEHASPRKLALSVELAYLLVSTSTRGLRIFYDGEAVLKGVMKEKPYPIIWFELDPESDGDHADEHVTINRLRDTLTGRSKADPEILRNYLRAWFRAAGPAMVVPFIQGDSFDEFVPYDSFAGKLEEITDKLQRVLIVKDDEAPGKDDVPTKYRDVISNLPPADADPQHAASCGQQEKAEALLDEKEAIEK